jgi:hypothetical protein
VIEVDASFADRADVAVEWLGDNGYDISGIGPDTLRVYLEQDMNLLAFRREQDADSGSIRPVMITYPGVRPVIPIQPTAVAATEDMGILVWVLGNGRAVPENYLSLELNDARIDWTNPGPTYDAVVSAAADEAGGWGFVTEQAGPAGPFADIVYPEIKSKEFDALAHTGSLSAFMAAVAVWGRDPNTGAYLDGFLEVMNDPELVPLRPGVTGDQFVNCVPCYFTSDYIAGEDPVAGVDREGLLEALAENVHRPLANTRRLFREQGRVTRLYTTLSPDEMTIDPKFVINPGLEDVSNVHFASQRVHCDRSWSIVTEQGFRLGSGPSGWPIAVDETAMPYNARLLQHSSSGSGEVLMDNSAPIDQAIDELGVGPRRYDDDSGFCTLRVPRKSDGMATVAFMLLAISALRRRAVRVL